MIEQPRSGPTLETLVVVFLRGGADGLHLVPPYEDDAYHRARPTLAVGRRDVLPLSSPFGLHRALSPLRALFDEGQLALVHGVGSEDETRSHFEAQDLMEHGGRGPGGWLGRFLRALEGEQASPLAALSFGTSLAESLRGAPSASVLASLDDLALPPSLTRLLPHLRTLYDEEGGDLARVARDAIEALRRLESIHRQGPRRGESGDYPDTAFGVALRDAARLLRAELGVRVAAIDLPGWDSHLAQASALEGTMGELATGLRAFCSDLGPRLATTAVVVLTEFGRRVYENASLGTDHGRAGVAMIAGGNLGQGHVLGRWSGLAPEALVGPGDVPVTTNYRSLLTPLLRLMGADDGVIAATFPGPLPPPAPGFHLSAPGAGERQA